MKKIFVILYTTLCANVFAQDIPNWENPEVL
jgi:hypothetical protein